MAIITTKPNVRYLWASEGNKAEPSTNKRLQGWVQEVPPHEMANDVEYKQELALKYIFQEGISDWDNSFEYSATSYVKYEGIIYKSLQNSTGYQPDINPLFWVRAFDDFGASDDVRDRVDKIENEEGYLDLYVSKAVPIMEGVANAPEFQVSNNGAFTFEQASLTGMFINANNEPEFRVNNQVKATVSSAANWESDDTSLVTTAMLKQAMTQQISLLLPVGMSIITQNPANPATYLGFGQWQQDCQGRAIVGVSADITSNTPDWKKIVNNQFGEDDHILSLSEIPSHNHTVEPFTKLLRSSGQNTPRHFDNTPTEPDLSGGGNADILTQGGDQPHNNVQMSQTKYIWTRIL